MIYIISTILIIITKKMIDHHENLTDDLDNNKSKAFIIKLHLFYLYKQLGFNN